MRATRAGRAFESIQHNAGVSSQRSPTRALAFCNTLLSIALLADCSARSPDDRLNRASGAGGAGPAAAGSGTMSPAADGGSGFDNAAMPAAGSGGPVAGTTAGATGKRQADLDPNVVFDWEQTAPGTASSDGCRAGVYTGTFACTFMADPAMFGMGLGGFTQEVTGPISLELEKSANGEFLQIADGEFSAIAQLFFGLRAQLKGNLDCKTLQLSATTVGGMWALGDPNMPLLPGGTFDANVQGKLDPQSRSLAGQWQVISGTIPGTCTGEWSATYTP
jgi:hypothetical protein